MQKGSYSDKIDYPIIEMAAYLFIVVVLTVGGLVAYSKAMAKYKITQTLEQAAVIITNIKSIYPDKDDYSGFNTDAAIRMDIIPRQMIKNASIENPYGGHIFITPSKDNRRLFITIAGLPETACTTIGSANWGDQIGFGVLSVATISQEEETPIFKRKKFHIGKLENRTLPLNAALASLGCRGPGEKKAVIIEYK